MDSNGNKTGTRFSFKRAFESAKETPNKGTGNFFHLEDGESALVVFKGDGLEISGAWDERRFKPWREEYVSKGLRRSERYAFVAILHEERRAVVIEINKPTLIEWGEDLPDGVDDMLVKLKRIGGRGDPKARITARPVRPLKASESDELDAVALPNLEAIYADFLNKKVA